MSKHRKIPTEVLDCLKYDETSPSYLRWNTKKPKSNTSGLKHISIYIDRRNRKQNILYRVVVQKNNVQYKRIFPYTE